ncbi:hypothetical protein EDD11_005008 [Mortierella claussenii]|nr:hypothetical protein EDD11_005008 [Mortierella claussenii]
MADANARLDFLWKASHVLLSSCPGASSHYMSQFLNIANSRDLKLHEDIQSKSCAACGSIFVPGINSKVKVVPVRETQTEREKRKKQARKKAKLERKKGQDQQLDVRQDDKQQDKDAVVAMSSKEPPSVVMEPARSSTIPKLQQQPNHRSSQPARKIIRIIPHTEIAHQQQQQPSQQLQRRQVGPGGSLKKIDKRANQVLNHIVYSCQRCHRDTELPGTKESYLLSRVKAQKPVSQRRKLKREKSQLQEKTGAVPSTVAKAETPSSSPTQDEASSRAPVKASKRPITALSAPILPDIKRSKHSTSLPTSPITGLSRSTSVASSAATSPVSSPRLDSNKLGGGSTKKKKKGGLASLLASQKAKDPPSDSGGTAGSGGDSVLANFLMGL